MLLIQPGFGLSIQKGHMFGEKESQRKMVSIRLPFISIYWLNREATNYWYTWPEQHLTTLTGLLKTTTQFVRQRERPT